MKLTLHPQINPNRPESTLSVAGDVLTVDGTAYDLLAIPDGGEGWPEGEHPFIAPISREGGVIGATVIVTLGDDAAPDQPRDPAHWIIPNATGAVTIPATRIEQEPAE